MKWLLSCLLILSFSAMGKVTVKKLKPNQCVSVMDSGEQKLFCDPNIDEETFRVIKNRFESKVQKTETNQ